MSTQLPYYPDVRYMRGGQDNPSASHPSQAQQEVNTQAYGSNHQGAIDLNMQPATPPRTPQRSNNAHYNSNARVQAVTDSASKPPRSKGKTRPKNVTTSAAMTGTDRQTQPLTGPSTHVSSARPISTPSTTAYAGPTFHASPAPSALPLPSFYSKSVPDSPGLMSFARSRKEETSSSGSDSPTQTSVNVAVLDPAREESPLDFIFNAHRQESARTRSATGPGSDGPFQPPVAVPGANHITPVTGSQSSKRASQPSFGSGSKMFVGELDGNNSPGKPFGPAFSTPYSQRLAAARSSTSPDAASGIACAGQPTTDRSQALKDFLFSQSPQNSPSKDLSFPDVAQPPNNNRTTSTPLRAHQNTYPRQYDSTSSTQFRTGNKASGLRREVEITPTKTPTGILDFAQTGSQQNFTPSYPAHRAMQVNGLGENAYSSMGSPSRMPPSSSGSDLRGMEDSLRRILKLEPSSSPSHDSGLTNLPAAASSVPNYVGGRAPPMNGLHNGVMGS